MKWISYWSRRISVSDNTTPATTSAKLASAFTAATSSSSPQDSCASAPCLNGGICFPGESSFVCLCYFGYIGSQCQFLDSCLSNPCLDGGICISDQTSFYCICRSPYMGSQCQLLNDTSTTPRTTTSNPCASNPCLNGALCGTTSSGFYCTCPPRFTGMLCEFVQQSTIETTMSTGPSRPTAIATTQDTTQSPLTNSCVSSPCMNNGICTVCTCGFQCHCPAGYTGRFCENNIPTTDTTTTIKPPSCNCPVEPNHCKCECQNNGICLRLSATNNFCFCPRRFTGRFCEQVKADSNINLSLVHIQFWNDFHYFLTIKWPIKEDAIL